MTVLGSKELRRRIEEEDLITGYIDLDVQLQPNGFDLSVENVFVFLEAGEIGFETRYIPNIEPVPLVDGIWLLKPGAYAIGLREKINLPGDLRAEAHPIMGDSMHRSTVMRCGNVTASGRWDVGYSGMGRSLLIVHNPFGLRLRENARVIQIKFERVEGADMAYTGDYQNETYLKKR
jgi:dUTP pyrophosphatase